MKLFAKAFDRENDGRVRWDQAEQRVDGSLGDGSLGDGILSGCWLRGRQQYTEEGEHAARPGGAACRMTWRAIPGWVAARRGNDDPARRDSGIAETRSIQRDAS